jgi:ligand-binding sensor domain-containing protein
MKKTLNLIITLLLPALLTATPAFIGLDPEREVSQYARRTWTMRDGMPQGGVQAIAQTPDGYLWLATDQGLARFDGTRFTVYTPATTPVLRAMAVSQLATSSTGTLWIVTEAAILTWKNGEFRAKDLPKGFSDLSIRSIAPSQEGRVWFATNLGVFSLGEDTTVQMTYPAALFPEKGPLSLHEMKDGTLLIGTVKGVYAGRNGTLRPHDAEGLKGAIVTRIAGDAQGIWALTPEDGVLSLTPDGIVRRYTAKDGLIPGRLFSLSIDGSGAAWSGGMGATINRIYKGTVSSVTTREGFKTEGVRALFCDREGNIWAGTSAAILHRYVNGAFVVHAAGKAEAEQMTWLVARDPAATPHSRNRSPRRRCRISDPAPGRSSSEHRMDSTSAGERERNSSLSEWSRRCSRRRMAWSGSGHRRDSGNTATKDSGRSERGNSRTSACGRSGRRGGAVCGSGRTVRDCSG